MGVFLRVAFGAIAATAALTSAGCRQLFGIDDTHAEPDAAADLADARPDAERLGICRTDHTLCVDFDTPDTGLAVLTDVSTIGVAVAEEVEADDAPSPPRILRAFAESSSATGGVLVGKSYFGGSLKSSSVQFWLRVSSPLAGKVCDPLVFVIAWVTDMMPAYQIGVSVANGSIVLEVDTPAISAQRMLPFERDRWEQVAVTFDSATGTVAIAVNGMPQGVQVPLAVGDLDAAVGIGVVASNDHGNCTAEFDDFVIDALP